MIEKVFPASVSEMDNVNAFVEEQLDALGCSMKASMQIMVAVEELFVNVASYAYPQGGGTVIITISDDGESVSITFTDSGIFFDPLAKKDPDITASAEERGIGGLGIFMVKKTMDDVKYNYQDGKNILTIVKKL